MGIGQSGLAFLYNFPAELAVGDAEVLIKILVSRRDLIRERIHQSF
jgi:hypothetical protein